MIILSAFTHPHIVANLFNIHSSGETKKEDVLKVSKCVSMLFWTSLSFIAWAKTAETFFQISCRFGMRFTFIFVWTIPLIIHLQLSLTPTLTWPTEPFHPRFISAFHLLEIGQVESDVGLDENSSSVTLYWILLKNDVQIMQRWGWTEHIICTGELWGFVTCFVESLDVSQ